MTTRIALISDIHGNAPALKAILAELDALPDLKHIYCLGDAVSIGPDVNEVLDLLFARPHQAWMAARLSATNAARLAELPATAEATYEGYRLLFLHYHWVDGRFVSWKPDLERLEAHYADAPVDVVCFGHFHTTHLFRGERRLYVDPGSAGCYDRPAARQPGMPC